MSPRNLAVAAAPLPLPGAPLEPDAGAALERDPGAPEAPPPAPEGADRIPAADLVARLVERHHAYERRALPYVVALCGKVAACHRARNPKLAALCDAGEELAEALEARLDEEERHLFPALLSGDLAGDSVRGELDRMQRHHRELSLLLARIRWLADDFAVPAWGGRGYQALMEELEALEEDLLGRIHLQHFALGPRLSSLCAGAC